MKNNIVIAFIILCILLAFTACGKTAGNPAGTAPESSGSSALVSEASASEQTESVTSTPDASKAQSTVTASNSPTDSAATSAANSKARTISTKPPVSSAKTPSQSQAAVSKPPITSTPAPSSAPAPAFDPQPYYDYAKSYGISQGLKFDSSMNKQDNAWDQPLSLYSALSKSTMEANIRSGINFIIHEGNTDFGLYLEKHSDGYYLYMFYA